MNRPKILAVVATAIATTAGLASWSPAAAERSIKFAAPASLTETIYLPDCPPDDDAERGWHPGTICEDCR